MKFCSDCLYCRPSNHKGLAAYKFARCARPRSEKLDGYAVTHPDILTQDDIFLEDAPYCRVERMNESMCDTEGKYFVPKGDAT